jgi:hypothetical protein
MARTQTSEHQKVELDPNEKKNQSYAQRKLESITQFSSSGSGSTESTISEMKTFINPGTALSALAMASRKMRTSRRADGLVIRS